MLVSDAEAKAAELLEQAEQALNVNGSRCDRLTQLAFAYITLAECLKT